MPREEAEKQKEYAKSKKKGNAKTMTPEKAFRIANFMDKCRWEDPRNYQALYYIPDGLSADERLLTHWLCYVSDRQARFRRAWKVGGFVYSDIVHQFFSGDKDVIKKDGECFRKIIRPNTSAGKGNAKREYAFASVSAFPNDELKYIEGYGCVCEDGGKKRICFAPRFFPDDYCRIFLTLRTLDGLKKDKETPAFAGFLSRVLECTSVSGAESNVRMLAYSLFLLTYANDDRPVGYGARQGKILAGAFDDPKFGEWIDEWAEKRIERISGLLSSQKDLKDECDAFFQSQRRYEIKRVWCALRDFIKSTAVRDGMLKPAFEETGADPSPLFSEKELPFLELPGDVWNENENFARCFLSEFPFKDEKAGKVIRKTFDGIEGPKKTGYPEQFDFSFDFAQRMCTAYPDSCQACPFFQKPDGIMMAFCRNTKESEFCPVVFSTCGYFAKCKEKEKCFLRTLLKEGGGDK